MNVPQRYVIRTLPILSFLNPWKASGYYLHVTPGLTVKAVHFSVFRIMFQMHSFRPLVILTEVYSVLFDTKKSSYMED